MSQDNGKDRHLNVKTAPPAYTPEDVVMEVKVVLCKDGRAFLHYPHHDIGAGLGLFTKGLDIFTGIISGCLQEQEQRRVIPITTAQVPPGVKLR